MKKILVIITTALFLMTANQSFAAIELIEKKLVDGLLVHSICVDGYKFLHAVYVSGELYTQFVQVYETKNKKTQPSVCEIKNKKEK